MRETFLSKVFVRALVEVAQERGVTPEALVGCTAEALSSGPPDARVSLAEFQRLMARAIRLTGDPALGLHCGMYASESSFGLMSPLVSHAQTLRHGIQLVSQFHALLFDGVRVQLSEHSGIALLRFELHVPIDQSVTELIVAGQVRKLRGFGCTCDDIRAVYFEYPQPPQHRAYAAAFSGAERFSQSFTGIEFRAEALDRPHIHRQPELHAVLHAQAQRSLERLSRPLTFIERVRALLGHQPAKRAPDMADAARELGLSVRSLRRRLEEEGTSYRALRQSQLEVSARSMLRDANLTLQSIAHDLGFADSAAFHRAFKHWTGLTPLAYRTAALRGELPSSDD